MSFIDNADIVISAAAKYVAGALGQPEVAVAAIIERTDAEAVWLESLPDEAQRRALCVEAAIVGATLAYPRNPAEGAYVLGLRPTLGWGWAAGERLMDALDGAVSDALNATAVRV